jgi:D,D-heptose 1,7-bisphosphate phosphatase
MDLVILAGGKGTRISRYVKNCPKPLIKIGKLNFLDYLIGNICKYNLKNIYILCGYKGEQIKKKYHNTQKNFVKIKCIIETKQLGTAGSLYQLKNIISKNFIVVNGDSFLEFDFNKLINCTNLNNQHYMCLIKNKNYLSNKKLSNLKIVKMNRVNFSDKSILMNAGIYRFNNKIFNYIKTKKYLSLEDNVIPILIDNQSIKGIECKNFFLDIGTKKNLLLSKKILPLYFQKPAIFLDRDGTINYDKGYTYKIEDLKFQPKIISFLQNIKKNKVYLFIVTNQAGIGKKYFTINQFFNFQISMKQQLIKKNILINDVKFCPYHPKAIIKKYRKKSGYRKPGTLMINEILKEWYIDKKNSIFIGNNKIDFQCALNAGIKYYDINDIDKIKSKKF